MKRLFFYVFFALLMFCRLSQGELVFSSVQAHLFIEYQQAQQPLDLGEVDYWVVESRDEQKYRSPYDLSQVAWKSIDAKALNFGNRDDVIWIRFSLVSEQDVPSDWVLKIHWSTLRSVALYLHDMNTGNWHTGPQFFDWHVDLDNIDAIPYALPFTVPAFSTTDVYLRVEPNEKQIIPLGLFSQDGYFDWMSHRNLWLGILFGALFSMLGYNLSLSIFLRDQSYGIYCLYVASILLYTAVMSGVGQAYLWNDNEYINRHAYSISSSLAFLCVALFIHVFLRVNRNGAVVRLLSRFAIGSWSLIFIFSFFLDSSMFHVIADIAAYASCYIGLGLSSYLWLKGGNPSAKYLTLAWIFLVSITSILVLGLADVIEYQPWMQILQYVGFLIEVIFLSMALAERVNRERQKRERAQKNALHLSMQAKASREREFFAQSRLLEMERDSNLRLEMKVEEKTAALRHALNSLEIANTELNMLAITDPLTELANRRRLDQKLNAIFSLGEAEHWRLSIMMLDIDHFKSVNDEYGHKMGDLCLKSIACFLKETIVKDDDLVARFGGEEFCILMMNQHHQSVYQVAERIRKTVESTPIHIGEQLISVTISIGICSGMVESHTSAHSMLEQADRALYRAKAEGRNRIKTTLTFDTDRLDDMP